MSTEFRILPTLSTVQTPLAPARTLCPDAETRIAQHGVSLLMLAVLLAGFGGAAADEVWKPFQHRCKCTHPMRFFCIDTGIQARYGYNSANVTRRLGQLDLATVVGPGLDCMLIHVVHAARGSDGLRQSLTNHKP